MNKKLFVLLPAAMMVLTACGGGNTSSSSSSTGSSTGTTTGTTTGSSSDTSSTGPVVKSSLQIAYEAAAALENKAESSDKYTFSGVISAVTSNTFYVQDGEYGMLIYGGKTNYAQPTDIGKNVEIISTLTNYNGLLETKTIESVTIGEAGTPVVPVDVTSVEQLGSMKQSILANIRVKMPDDLSMYSWSDSASPLTVTKLGSDDVTVKFEKYAYTAELGAKYIASEGTFTTLTNVLTSGFNASGEVGTNQFIISGQLGITSEPKVLESIAVKTAPTKVKYAVGDDFDPTGLVITATYEDESIKDIPYAGHESEFSFDPLTDLEEADTKVVITWGGKSVDQAITVEDVVATQVICKSSASSVQVGGTVTLSAEYNGTHSGTTTFEVVASGTTGDASIDGDTLTGVTAGDVYVKAVSSAPALESEPIKIVVTAAKSSIQVAYEAAIKTGTTESTEQYTFTGTITGLMSSSKGFYVQDGEYAMYVYAALPQGALAGKEVTVTSKVVCYNNVLPETSGTPSVVVNGDGATILPASVSSQQEINDLKINTLVNTKATVTSSFLSDVAAWSSGTSKNPKLKVGSDQITMNFDKNSYNDCKALQTAFAALKDGDEIDLTKAVVRCYNGTNQFGAMTETRIEVKADPITDVSIKTPMRTEYVAGQYLDPSDLIISVSHESGVTEDVAYVGHESDFEFDPSLITVLTTEHTELVITYKGIEFDPVTLTVVEKTIVSATIKTQPSKLEYNDGETFDPSGLVLTVTYDDESTDEVVYTSLDEGFEFDPNLQTPLDITMNSVAVTYVEVDAGTVAIIVNSRPQVSYTRVSSELSDWSGTYLLAFDVDNSNAKLWTGIDAGKCFVDVTANNGVISEVPEGAVTLTIAPMAGGYSVMVNGGINNGKFIYGTKGKNALNFGDTSQLNTLSYDNSNKGVLMTSNETVMKYNDASGDTTQRFRYYKSGQKIVQLYKLG